MLNTGGPAFPVGNVNGMSLRDYFAAKAMQGFITGDYDVYPHEVAQKAYQIADEMLEARNKQ
jgi:hypothetical protein